MAEHDHRPLAGLNEEAALRTLLEGTAAETGTRFFAALVENLAKALGTHGAWVTEYFPQTRRLRALQHFGQRIGRKIEPLSPDAIGRLRAYNWPGNVRELQNVIERAVITSRDGHLNLDRALPDRARPVSAQPEPPATECADHIRTVDELQALERS